MAPTNVEERTGMLSNARKDSESISGYTTQPSWGFGLGFGFGGFGKSNTRGFRPIDAETGKEQARWCPEEDASWFSKLYYLYVDSLIKMGARKHLEQSDLWDIAGKDDAAQVYEDFRAHLDDTVDSVKAPKGVVWRAIWTTHGYLFIWTGILKLIHDLIMFLPPFILERLLHHMSSGGSRSGSFWLAASMLGAAVLENVTINIYFHALYRMSLHLKIDMVQMIYEKSLRVTSAVKSEMGVGTIANLQSNDASKIWNLPLYLHIVWNGPFQIFIVMAMLVRIMNWAPAMAGLVITVVMIPLSTLVGKALGNTRRAMVKQTDARVKLASEIITGIKAIKLYAWEDAYVERISELREEELRHIRTTQMMSALNTAVFQSGPVLVSLAAFLVYSAMGYSLTAAVAFPALSLFNLLRFPIIMFPSQVMNMIHARVGLQRIQKFMEAEEMDAQTHARKKSKKAQQASADAAAGPSSSAAAAGTTADADAAAHVAASSSSPAVSVRGGTFSWDAGSAEAVLRGVDLEVPRGKLVMVVGQVGAGKSSLLAAVLGEMHRKMGQVHVQGSVAYTAQDPWIQNTTLRSNVLLGHAYREEVYCAVLAACALLPDLEMLPAGDATEIGEKGVNLSGGQKHRVALARACYADADVYLLDDPLSAVDAHVGRHLFDACICGLLSHKTRILVTHQLQYLPSADLVVVMAEGEITEVGTYADLTARGVDLHKFVKKGQQGQDAEEQQGDDIEDLLEEEGQAQGSSAGAAAAGGAGTAAMAAPAAAGPELISLEEAPGGAATSGKGAAGAAHHGHTHLDDAMMGEARERLLKLMAKKEQDGKIVKVEERAVGRVDRAIYRSYLSAWSLYIPFLPLLVVGMAFGERGLQVGQNFVLSGWSNDTTRAALAGEEPHTKRWISLYFALGLVSIVVQLFRAVATIAGSIAASRSLHNSLLAKVVRLPMAFFDSQPTGRLLNRFTKDTEAVDVQVSGSVSMALICGVNALLSVVVVAIVSPVALVAIVPLGWLYWKVQNLYIASSRELKRLDALAYSPIFAHFGESLHGLQTIRAFDKQAFFVEKNKTNLNSSNRAYWPIQVVNRWLSVRLELMGAFMVFVTAVCVAVVLPQNAGLTGLAITSALNLTGIMNWAVRQMTELEVNMNSVERMVEYLRYDEEAPPVVPGRVPPPGWPAHGAITVSHLTVKYRPELEPVLKDLSFSVRGCEKVGVCGRTGCGKSTLMITLYRLVEPCGGSILIDGVDVCGIGLRDLRSRLSLVPQDPVIFSGTIRSNLDPFGTSPGDHAIWEALKRAGMDGFVGDMEGGLDAPIKEGGANLSVGQRQLLCMARALLRASRILVLDEATSNVDNATDGLIQRTIRTAFKDCTVLTIAHRLHTIVDSDRILLLDAGRLAEFDAPGALMRDPSSKFRRMIEETTRGGGLNADLVAAALANGANSGSTVA